MAGWFDPAYMGAPCGPAYNVGGAAVDKWRRTARGRDLALAEKRAYGAAVLAAVRAKKRAELQSYVRSTGLSTKCPCASGVWASDAKSILAAVRRQNRAMPDALDNWRARPGAHQRWEGEYATAMKKTRAARAKGQNT